MKLENGSVVVIGGAGFIGSHLVDCLLAAKHSVFVVDDFSTGCLKNLARHNGNSRLSIKEADVRDEETMIRLLDGADYVFHLAVQNVRLSLRRPTLVHEVNATGTLNVLKAAAAAGVKRFLYCSSSEVNGTADVVPMPEDYHFRPETIYGASKLAGEYYTQVFQRAGWLPTIIARPHNTYGPREHYEGYLGEVIPRFILLALAGKPLTIYGDGTQSRDFTYVSETSDFLLRLMECDCAVGGTYNVCRGQEVSIREIAELIAELSGSKTEIRALPSRPGDVLRLCGDPTRLREVLGDSPRISIREGLSRTLDWFRENVPLTEEVLASIEPENWDGLKAEPWMWNLPSHGYKSQIGNE
jgi:UDP-glucose 4-epimerase